MSHAQSRHLQIAYPRGSRQRITPLTQALIKDDYNEVRTFIEKGTYPHATLKKALRHNAHMVLTDILTSYLPKLSLSAQEWKSLAGLPVDISTLAARKAISSLPVSQSSQNISAMLEWEISGRIKFSATEYEHQWRNAPNMWYVRRAMIHLARLGRFDIVEYWLRAREGYTGFRQTPQWDAWHTLLWSHAIEDDSPTLWQWLTKQSARHEHAPVLVKTLWKSSILFLARIKRGDSKHTTRAAMYRWSQVWDKPTEYILGCIALLDKKNRAPVVHNLQEAQLLDESWTLFFDSNGQVVNNSNSVQQSVSLLMSMNDDQSMRLRAFLVDDKPQCITLTDLV